MIETSTTEESKVLLSKRAMKARLHNNEFVMSQLQRAFIKQLSVPVQESLKVISVATVDGRDIGVCVVRNDNCIMTFVNPSYRREGIGSKLLKSVLMDGLRSGYFAFQGDSRGTFNSFWEKQDIRVIKPKSNKS